MHLLHREGLCSEAHVFGTLDGVLGLVQDAGADLLGHVGLVLQLLAGRDGQPDSMQEKNMYSN